MNEPQWVPIRFQKLSFPQLAPLNHSLQNLRFNTSANIGERNSTPYLSVIASTADGTSSSLASPKVSLHPDISTSRVVYVSGTTKARLDIRELCNLFSNYGNIEAGIQHKLKNCSFIMYSTQQGADLAVKHMRKLHIQGLKLLVTYSKFEELQEAQLKQMKDVYIPSPSCRRFKTGVPSMPNEISRTLHICIFLTGYRRKVEDYELINIVSEVSSPIRVKRDENKDNLNMWFVEFPKISDALWVIMKCHDRPFEDGNFRISFTKTKRG